MLSKDTTRVKKILIVGDSGRGKSALAKALSQKLNIKHYSTDDFFWKVKYTEKADRQTSLKKISSIYNQRCWIVEGATRSLIKEGIEKSDQIVYLVYPNLLSQFWILFKRKLTRQEETWTNLFNFYKHLICKKYKLGPHKGKIRIHEMLKPFSRKVTKLHSFKEIDDFVQKL